MKKLILNKREVALIFWAVFLVCCLAFGFGYFFGRYEQIVINKSTLELIPDVNCGLVDDE